LFTPTQIFGPIFAHDMSVQTNAYKQKKNMIHCLTVGGAFRKAVTKRYATLFWHLLFREKKRSETLFTCFQTAYQIFFIYYQAKPNKEYRELVPNSSSAVHWQNTAK